MGANISTARFEPVQLVDAIWSELKQSGLAPGRLKLEIRESALLVNGTATRDILHALRGLGTRVSVDDFGTWYSNFELPAQLHV